MSVMSGQDQEKASFEAWLERDEPRDEARFGHFIPTYLAPLLPAGGEVVSIGCGSGLDVEMLRARGFRAFGFDPSRTSRFKHRSPDAQEALRVGKVTDRPFGDRKFDAAYCLEVIEHVGCLDFGTRVTDTTWSERVAFLEACLDLVRPGGFLLVTSSNKLCPIDPGHPHNYTLLGRAVFQTFGLGLSAPAHAKNFLWSVGDVRRALDETSYAGRWSLEVLPVGTYPKITSRRSLKGLVARQYLSLVSQPALRGSGLNPILSLRVRLAGG